MLTILERLPEYRELDTGQRRAVRRRLWQLVFSWQWVRESILVKLLVLGPAVLALLLMKLAEVPIVEAVGVWGLFALCFGLGLISATAAWVWLTRRSLPIWRRVIAEQAWNGRARFCLRCGYDLRQSEGDDCVECGASRWTSK